MLENIRPLSTDQLSEIKKRFLPFVQDVRRRLLLTAYSFIFFVFVGFFFYERIIKFLISFLALKGINIVFTSPFQFINLSISCGLATGLVAIFPIILYQILSFLKPALKEKEYRLITKFLPFSIFLFLVGFLFGSIIMKWQIDIFLDRSVSLGIGNVLDISHLLSTVLITSALMGVGFQFPIILLTLMKLGLVKHKQLASKRSWVYLGSFIFALFLPPDSILADVLLALPLIILFEITLLLSHSPREDKD